MRGRHHPWAQVVQVLHRSRAVGHQAHQAGASSSDTGQREGVADFGDSMDARVRGLGWGAWRAEGLHRSVAVDTVQEVDLAYTLVGVASDPSVVMRTWPRSVVALSGDRAWVARRGQTCKRPEVVVPCQTSWAVQDMHREDMRTHIREELTDLPRTGAAELAVAQEGPYAVIVAVAVSGLAGTFACTVCPDMANLH